MSIQFDGDKVVRDVNSDPEFVVAARDWNAVVRFQIDDEAWDAVAVDGRLESFGPATDRRPTISYAGPTSEWEKLFSKQQPPRHWGVSMMALVGLLEQSADSVLVLGQAFGPIFRITEALRAHVSNPTEIPSTADPYKEGDGNIVGGYVYINVDGTEHRVYYEEAGEGVPILLQHTAGNSSVQWHHFLANPEMQKRYRMISYDLPYHGSSLPPLHANEPWWEVPEASTKEDLMSRIVAISHALELEQPIFMGCSIGGNLALDLAAYHADEFRAVVSLNPKYGGWRQPENFDPTPAIEASKRMSPRINKEPAAVSDYLIASPLVPESSRREIWWEYGQGAPNITTVDGIYHNYHHDLRKDGHLIDGTRRPVYVIISDYDHASEGPGGGRDVGNHIPSVRMRTLTELSHFMMADDPVRFSEAIAPILEEAVRDTSAAEPAALSTVSA